MSSVNCSPRIIRALYRYIDSNLDSGQVQLLLNHFRYCADQFRPSDQTDSANTTAIIQQPDLECTLNGFTTPLDLDIFALSLLHCGFYRPFTTIHTIVNVSGIEAMHRKVRSSMPALTTNYDYCDNQPCSSTSESDDQVLYNNIQFHRRLLQCKLQFGSLLQYLERIGVLESEECGNITAITVRAQQMDMLLSCLSQRPHPDKWSRLVEGLSEGGQFELFSFVIGDGSALKSLENLAKLRRNALKLYHDRGIYDNIPTTEHGSPSLTVSKSVLPQDVITPLGLLDIHVDVTDAESACQAEFYRNNRSNIYKNFSTPKGLALLINNKTFEIGYSKRTGTDTDEENIKKLLVKLGYNVAFVYRDLTALEMMCAARDFSQRAEHRDAHSCVVVVLTHGQYDCLVGVDGRQLRLHEEFLHFFSVTQAPFLAGKPKIFILQACRGNEYDHGKHIIVPKDYVDANARKANHTRTDGPLTSMMRGLGLMSPHSETVSRSSSRNSFKLPSGIFKTRPKPVSPSTASTTTSRFVSSMRTAAFDPLKYEVTETKSPIMADYLIAYSTVPGYVSWRNSQIGTWFIQSICEVFSKDAASEDILSMLTKVNRRVAKVYESTDKGQKQIPEFCSRLQRKFYFFPGVNHE